MFKSKLIFILALCVAPFLVQAENASHHVLVSVAPHKFFVEKIADGTVTVGLMVPAGASAHTFEPTPKQMIAASKADLWFCVGESFEARAVKSLTTHNSNMKTVDLRQNVDMITADPLIGSCCCCHSSNNQDLHIWLSARQAKIQATTIANTLSQRYPENTARYQRALASFLQELDTLDAEIAAILKPLKQRMVMVSHPAYAYFCRDYALTQLSIEIEGKDPTPQQLNTILNKARAAPIKKIYIQVQYNSKGARLFAKELNAQIVMLDPYAEDYIISMREIARQFAAN